MVEVIIGDDVGGPHKVLSVVQGGTKVLVEGVNRVYKHVRRGHPKSPQGGRLSREISDACLQYYGGMGFMNETPISRSYRDTRLGSIGGGADEVMLSIICKHMGILPGKRNR